MPSGADKFTSNLLFGGGPKLDLSQYSNTLIQSIKMHGRKGITKADIMVGHAGYGTDRLNPQSKAGTLHPLIKNR